MLSSMSRTNIDSTSSKNASRGGNDKVKTNTKCGKPNGSNTDVPEPVSTTESSDSEIPEESDDPEENSSTSAIGVSSDNAQGPKKPLADSNKQKISPGKPGTNSNENPDEDKPVARQLFNDYPDDSDGKHDDSIENKELLPSADEELKSAKDLLTCFKALRGIVVLADKIEEDFNDLKQYADEIYNLNKNGNFKIKSFKIEKNKITYDLVHKDDGEEIKFKTKIKTKDKAKVKAIIKARVRAIIKAIIKVKVKAKIKAKIKAIINEAFAKGKTERRSEHVQISPGQLTPKRDPKEFSNAPLATHGTSHDEIFGVAASSTMEFFFRSANLIVDKKPYSLLKNGQRLNWLDMQLYARIPTYLVLFKNGNAHPGGMYQWLHEEGEMTGALSEENTTHHNKRHSRILKRQYPLSAALRALRYMHKHMMISTNEFVLGKVNGKKVYSDLSKLKNDKFEKEEKAKKILEASKENNKEESKQVVVAKRGKKKVCSPVLSVSVYGVDRSDFTDDGIRKDWAHNLAEARNNLADCINCIQRNISAEELQKERKSSKLRWGNARKLLEKTKSQKMILKAHEELNDTESIVTIQHSVIEYSEDEAGEEDKGAPAAITLGRRSSEEVGRKPKHNT